MINERIIRWLIVLLMVALLGATFKIDACELSPPSGIPTTSRDTKVLCRHAYVNVYWPACRDPLVVIEHLKADSIGGNEPRQMFKVDPDLDKNEQATPADYGKSGYDKGHQAPAADFRDGVIAMKESFLLSNAVPQDPRHNRGIWRSLEMRARGYAVKYQSVWIYTGTTYKNSPKMMNDRVCVPDTLYKVIVDPTTNRYHAYMIPNNKNTGTDLSRYKVTLSAVERAAAVKLFPSNAPQNGLE